MSSSSDRPGTPRPATPHPAAAPPPTSATPPLAGLIGTTGSVRRAVVGVLAAFALNGMFVGAFGAVQPGLRERFATDRTGLAVLMVASGIAAVTTMQLGGRWADRSGARLPTLAAAPVMAVGLAILAWAPTHAAGIAGAVVFGAGNGCMDVCMNTLAVHVERRRGRPVMSRFHAFFSVGSAAGGAVAWLVGAFGVAHDTRVAVTLVAAIAVGLTALAVMRPAVPQSEPEPRTAAGDVVRAPLPRATWLLGAMAICFGLTEGTGFDWSSVHVRDVTGVDTSTAALGVVCVSVFMVVIRLVGDHLVERFGHRRVVSVGSATAVCGYVVAVVATGLPVVLAGWCLVGLGVGMIAPQIYGTAGNLGGGRVMGVVVGFGYTAFLTGPALIGTLSDHVGIARAMLVPLTTGVALVVMARWMPRVSHADVAARRAAAQAPGGHAVPPETEA